jgi:O-antigen ligase
LKIHIKSKDILAFQILLTAFVALSNFKLVLYIAQLICLVILFQKVVRNGYRVKCKEYFIFFGAFTIWSVLSVGWAAVPDYSLMACKSIIQSFFIGLIIMMTISTPEKIDEMLRTFPFANIVMIICLVIETKPSEWASIIHGTYTVASAEGRLGYSIGLFPNSLGEICAVFSAVLYYLYIKEKKKKYLALILLNFVIVLLTKSRTSLFFMLVCLIGVIFFYAKKAGKIKVILISLCSCVVLLWAVLNIPALYEVIGFRVEGLIGIFNSSKYVTDDSTLGRMKLLRVGIKVFEGSPLIGVGINNYGYYAYNYWGIWTIVPAHNNYIELLADIGIIGTFFYYILIYVSLFRGIRMIKKTNQEQRAVLSVLLILLIYRVIADFFGVSYLEDFLQVMNFICVAGVTRMYYKRESR